MSSGGRLALFIVLFVVLLIWNASSMPTHIASTTVTPKNAISKNDPAQYPGSWTFSQKTFAEDIRPAPWKPTFAPSAWNPQFDFGSTPRPVGSVFDRIGSFASQFGRSAMLETLDDVGDDEPEDDGFGEEPSDEPEAEPSDEPEAEDSDEPEAEASDEPEADEDERFASTNPNMFRLSASNAASTKGSQPPFVKNESSDMWVFS